MKLRKNRKLPTLKRLIRAGGVAISIGIAYICFLQHLFIYPNTNSFKYNIYNHDPLRNDEQNLTNKDLGTRQIIDDNEKTNNTSFNTTTRFRTNPNNSDRMKADQFLKLKIKSKQFSKYHHDFPCFPQSYEEEKEATGVYYIKVFKTASSTVSHIVKYIANKRHCKQHSDHAAAHTFYSLRNRKTNQAKSFLFTFIREPTKRAVSDFFFQKVTGENKEVNLYNFQNGWRRSIHKLDGQAGYQLAYISTEQKLPEYLFWNSSDPEMIQHPSHLLDRLNNVFNSYDFIGVSERLNESLVVLSFILDLSLNEIVYLSYRQSGSSYMEIKKKCVKLAKAHLPEDVEVYLKTDEWEAITAGDRMLHRTAIEALDRTIDNVIGRDIFERRMKKYEALLELMKECEEECSSFCSKDGEYRETVSCLPCMNKIRANSSEDVVIKDDEWNLKLAGRN